MNVYAWLVFGVSLAGVLIVAGWFLWLLNLIADIATAHLVGQAWWGRPQLRIVRKRDYLDALVGSEWDTDGRRR